MDAEEVESLTVLAHESDVDGWEMKDGRRMVAVPRMSLVHALLSGSLPSGYVIRARLSGELLPHRWRLCAHLVETRGQMRGLLDLQIAKECDAPPNELPPIGSVLEIDAPAGAS